MHVRFRCGDGVYRTFFWAALTIQPDKADAQGIFDVPKGHFEASDVSMRKVFFYASDGASVVYTGSEGGGVPGLFQREVNPKLLRVHCLSHRCALALKDSVEKSEWALWCDEIMHDITNPLARSSKRCRELGKVQEEMELVKLVVLRLVITIAERDKAAQLTRMDADDDTAGTPVHTPPGKDPMTETGQ